MKPLLRLTPARLIALIVTPPVAFSLLQMHVLPAKSISPLFIALTSVGSSLLGLVGGGVFMAVAPTRMRNRLLPVVAVMDWLFEPDPSTLKIARIYRRFIEIVADLIVWLCPRRRGPNRRTRERRTDAFIAAITFLVPAKLRGDTRCTLMDDARAQRLLGWSEWVVRFYVVWQSGLLLFMSAPTALREFLFGWLKRIVR